MTHRKIRPGQGIFLPDPSRRRFVQGLATGGIIAGLEKEITELKARLEPPPAQRHPWWRRFLGK